MRILRDELMFKLYQQLPKDEGALRDHIEGLRSMTDDRNKAHHALFDHLYECLSILDSKASSLLGFNSIIIAVFAIFMTGDLDQIGWIVVSIGMASILTSCLLLLSVVWIHWSTTENFLDLERHALILLRVRRVRTIRYRLAWYCAIFALGFCLPSLLVLPFVWQLLFGVA